MSRGRLASSFRDPSGFLFERDGVLLRQVNESYAEHFDLLSSSGLYDALVERGWLVAHEEVDVEPAEVETAHRIIAPVRVPFVAYPYEWCFSQYREAALRTLDIELLALEHGMTLKDASAYNVQFVDCRPVLIDTLSFERYEEGRPWVAYRQFCQHFLAPLALMSYRDVRLGELMRTHLDGVPLDLACVLLPGRARLRFPLLSHLFLHARGQRAKAGSGTSVREYEVGKLAMRGIVESLRKGVSRLTWSLPETQWGEYYSDTNYSEVSADHKSALVEDALEKLLPKSLWDLGANTGRFSRLASGRGIQTVAFDFDPVAVEKNYLAAREANEKDLLPLRMDLSNPSPALGWDHRERESLIDRGPADAVLALALVHHLAIGNNVPLARISAFLARAARHLLVEWVPKSDSQVQRLLASREDVFPDYDEECFVTAFSNDFEIEGRDRIRESGRVLYRMARRGDRSSRLSNSRRPQA